VLAGGRVLCSYTGTEVPEALLDRIQTGKEAGGLLHGDNVTNRIVVRASADAIRSGRLPLVAAQAAYERVLALRRSL
jgi:hypothetical protein